MGDPPIAFPEEGNVVVLALSLSAPFGSEEPYDCQKNWDRLVWIHNDQFAIDATDPKVPGLRIHGVMCARLVYQYFLGERSARTEQGYWDPPSLDAFKQNRVNEPPILRALGASL